MRDIVDLLNYSGRSEKCTIGLDAAFVRWLLNPEVPQLKKGMKGMMQYYRMLLEEKESFSLQSDSEAPDPLPTDESLRVHIYSILWKKGLKLKKPKTVDIDRFRIYDALKNWWQDPQIRSVIDSVDSRLLFNADETSICRSADTMEKILAFPDPAPIGPSFSCGSKHSSLFAIISAAGYPVTPYVILHCEKEQYVDRSLLDFATYRTRNGHMDHNTFFKVMTDIFIPYVESVREGIQGNEGNKHAVLVVDGHGSRYYLPSLFLLRQYNIDVLVLPVHSSHVTQPLDLGLNNLIKLHFRQPWHSAHPVVPDKDREPGRRPSKRSRMAVEGESHQGGSAGLQVAQTADPMIYMETPEETEDRVSKAVYRRAKLVKTLLLALHDKFTTDNIQTAWRTAHLRPLAEDPPYTREKEEHYIKEALAMGIIPEETQRQRDHIVGIVTSDTAIEFLRAQIHSSRRERGRRRSTRGRRRCCGQSFHLR